MNHPWSIWLLPDREDLIKYKKLIDRFSLENGSIPFTPHVTLFGRVTIDPEPFFDFIEHRASVQGRLTSNISKISRGTPPWRSLYVGIDRDVHLDALQQDLIRPLKHVREYMFDPHLSLAYGDIRTTELSIEDISLDVTIGFSSVVLAYVPDDVDEWNLIKEFNFD